MDPFTGQPDPHDVRVSSQGVIAQAGDGLLLRVTVADGTDADGVEVECQVSGSADCLHPHEAIAEEIARYINRISPSEARMAIVRARAELHAGYEVTTRAEGGLHVRESTVRLRELINP